MKTRSFLALAMGLAALVAAPFNSVAAEFPPGSPKFVTDYAKVLADSKESGKPVILIFSASWCPPCQTMKKEVYPDAAVKPFHDKFIWAYLDADDEKNKKAMEKFGVEGIPHIEFLSSAGKSIGKQVGGGSPEDFAKKLKSLLAGANKS